MFVKLQKCRYIVTFDLDLKLDHVLDAAVPGNDCVKVC